jgi:hypothetical protein
MPNTILDCILCLCIHSFDGSDLPFLGSEKHLFSSSIQGLMHGLDRSVPRIMPYDEEHFH